MIGNSELLVVALLALILFGPKKLPELARGLGRAMAEYHRAYRETENKIQRSLRELEEAPKKEEKKDSGKAEEASEGEKA